MNTVNHVAILVSSVDDAAQHLSQFGFPVGPKEIWDGEGTAEIYVGEKGQIAKLLLMEPVKPGAYGRAMEKRGPGLHHIAVDVTSLEEFVTTLGGSGWYLHPHSLMTCRKTKTAWLARPGTKMLIEVQEREALDVASAFVSRLEVPLTSKEQTMVTALGIGTLWPSEDDRIWFVIDGQRIDLAAFLGG